MLDRVGAPLALVEAVSPYFTILAFAVLGSLLHSMRVSTYYAAGRAVPFEYAGFAVAALVAGLILPFAPQFSGRSWLFGVAGGVFTGVVAIGFYLGPMLRKTGAFSFSELLAARFPSLATRLGVIALACATSALIALAGEQSAVDMLAGLLGGGRGVSAAVVGCAVLLIAGPGGMLGTIWTAAAAGAVAVVGLGWPALMLAWRGAPPFGGAIDAQGEVAVRLEDWGAFANATSPSAGDGHARRDVWNRHAGAASRARHRDPNAEPRTAGGLRGFRLDIRLRLSDRDRTGGGDPVAGAPGRRPSARASARCGLCRQRARSRDHLRREGARSRQRAPRLRRQERVHRSAVARKRHPGERRAIF